MAEAGQAALPFFCPATGCQTLNATIHPNNKSSKAARRIGGTQSSAIVQEGMRKLEVRQSMQSPI